MKNTQSRFFFRQNRYFFIPSFILVRVNSGRKVLWAGEILKPWAKIAILRKNVKLSVIETHRLTNYQSFYLKAYRLACILALKRCKVISCLAAIFPFKMQRRQPHVSEAEVSECSNVWSQKKVDVVPIISFAFNIEKSDMSMKLK